MKFTVIFRDGEKTITFSNISSIEYSGSYGSVEKISNEEILTYDFAPEGVYHLKEDNANHVVRLDSSNKSNAVISVSVLQEN